MTKPIAAALAALALCAAGPAPQGADKGSAMPPGRPDATAAQPGVARRESPRPKLPNIIGDGCHGISTDSLATLGKVAADDGQAVEVVRVFGMHPALFNKRGERPIWGCTGYADVRDAATDRTDTVEITTYHREGDRLEVMLHHL